MDPASGLQPYEGEAVLVKMAALVRGLAFAGLDSAGWRGGGTLRPPQGRSAVLPGRPAGWQVLWAAAWVHRPCVHGHTHTLALQGITVLASSGDSGAFLNPADSEAQRCAQLAPQYPAASQWVTAVSADGLPPRAGPTGFGPRSARQRVMAAAGWTPALTCRMTGRKRGTASTPEPARPPAPQVGALQEARVQRGGTPQVVTCMSAIGACRRRACSARPGSCPAGRRCPARAACREAASQGLGSPASQPGVLPSPQAASSPLAAALETCRSRRRQPGSAATSSATCAASSAWPAGRWAPRAAPPTPTQPTACAALLAAATAAGWPAPTAAASQTSPSSAPLCLLCQRGSPWRSTVRQPQACVGLPACRAGTALWCRGLRQRVATRAARARRGGRSRLCVESGVPHHSPAAAPLYCAGTSVTAPAFAGLVMQLNAAIRAQRGLERCRIGWMNPVSGPWVGVLLVFDETFVQCCPSQLPHRLDASR